MRVLFVSGEMIAGDLAYRLKLEGCEVKLFIKDESRKDCFENMVEKTDDWKKELDWVGKDGLIVFDDVGYGKEQDDLRKQGYLVVGGSKYGDKLEKDREYGEKMLVDSGIKALFSKNFESIDEAINFVKENKKKWVVKQNNHISILNYVGRLDNGDDVASLLKSYKNIKGLKSINLQEEVDGIEIGTARYFNGDDWVGPVEINIEHKGLHNDDIGPKTAEMGTVIWYEKNNDFRLYKENLAKLKPLLKKIGFKGDVDINFIVNEKRANPIELTTRFGSPAIHLQDELHISKWKDFLLSIAKGKKFELQYKQGIGIVVCLCLSPFPYKIDNYDCYSNGVEIFFKDNLTQDELKRIHFEEVSFNKVSKRYYISGSNGFILYITGVGKNIEEARKSVYDLIDKIVIPKMFYRTDIGVKFMKTYFKLLKKWGWI